MEFDEVIVPYTSADSYKTDLDKSLLYIACTRAMHQLTLTFTKERLSIFGIDNLARKLEHFKGNHLFSPISLPFPTWMKQISYKETEFSFLPIQIPVLYPIKIFLTVRLLSFLLLFSRYFLVVIKNIFVPSSEVQVAF
ncbi:MAG: hypothetical protein U5K54_23115 [Cytophagales bacterium]|nr:hypothetical protein [Cytophagales bacterium]